MRLVAFLCCLFLAACAPGALNTGGQYSYDGSNEISNDVGSNYAALFGEAAPLPPPAFDAAKYPPQCNPARDFPGGKIPDDFGTSYYGPASDRFNVCIMDDARSKAVGTDKLSYMGEGTRKTDCAAADYYPDHKVHPAFYAYPAPPEYQRYLECLLAEAERDGGEVRLASDKSFPKVGACYLTRVNWIGTRWGEGKPNRDAGTQIGFENKLWLVDYGLIPQVARSRMGDPVRACVHDLPEDCPGNDLRGIGYRVRNLRTDEVFTMGDTQHMCRGA